MNDMNVIDELEKLKVDPLVFDDEDGFISKREFHERINALIDILQGMRDPRRDFR